MSNDHPKRLLVESPDDIGAITGLMRYHVNWEPQPKKYVVHVEARNSGDEILQKDFLSTIVKSSGLKVLGLMLDADTKFDARWASIKGFAKPRFPNVPDAMPAAGLVLQDADGLRFGAWVMPDNKSHGMLEDFCSMLVPNACKLHWDYADATCKQARVKGAPWRDAHAIKARVHTWLAWQDPPGERLGAAITKKILDPHSPKALAFVEWIKNLYQLPPVGTP